MYLQAFRKTDIKAYLGLIYRLLKIRAATHNFYHWDNNKCNSSYKQAYVFHFLCCFAPVCPV